VGGVAKPLMIVSQSFSTRNTLGDTNSGHAIQMEQPGLVIGVNQGGCGSGAQNPHEAGTSPDWWTSVTATRCILSAAARDRLASC